MSPVLHMLYSGCFISATGRGSGCLVPAVLLSNGEDGWRRRETIIIHVEMDGSASYLRLNPKETDTWHGFHQHSTTFLSSVSLLSFPLVTITSTFLCTRYHIMPTLPNLLIPLPVHKPGGVVVMPDLDSVPHSLIALSVLFRSNRVWLICLHAPTDSRLAASIIYLDRPTLRPYHPWNDPSVSISPDPESLGLSSPSL